MLKMGISKLQAKEDHALQIEHLQEIIEQAIIDQAIIEHLQEIIKQEIIDQAIIEHLQEIIKQAIIDHLQEIIEHLQVIGQHLRSHITGPPPPDRWDHHLVLPVQVVHIAVVQAEVVQAEVVVEDDKILLNHKLTKKGGYFK